MLVAEVLALGRWIVRSNTPAVPRFIDSTGEKWYDGDVITEEDLLSMYASAVIPGPGGKPLSPTAIIQSFIESGTLAPAPVPEIQ